MTRGTGPLTIAALILVLWGAVSCFLLPEGSAGLEPAAAGLKLHRVAAGILTIFLGVVLIHLPPLLRRGEYQAMRLVSLSFWFLLALALWLGLKSPGRTAGDYLPAAVFGLCALLVLISSFSVRRGLRLPRI
jgi:hypothetical protein